MIAEDRGVLGFIDDFFDLFYAPWALKFNETFCGQWEPPGRNIFMRELGRVFA